MAWLADGEKISKIYLFVLVQLTNVTDGHRVTAYTSLMHMHRAVETKNLCCLPLNIVSGSEKNRSGV